MCKSLSSVRLCSEGLLDNLPTCGQSSHRLVNHPIHELTSPQLDWLRVGLSANCPVTFWHTTRHHRIITGHFSGCQISEAEIQEHFSLAATPTSYHSCPCRANVQWLFTQCL